MRACRGARQGPVATAIGYTGNRTHYRSRHRFVVSGAIDSVRKIMEFSGTKSKSTNVTLPIVRPACPRTDEARDVGLRVVFARASAWCASETIAGRQLALGRTIAVAAGRLAPTRALRR